MARTKIRTTDIMNLWRYYFDDDAPTTAKRDAANVVVAVAGTTKRAIVRRDDPHRPGREFTDQLLEMGQYFTGTAVKFSQMYGDDLTELTIDTGHDFHMYIIPFRTESDDERVIDTVVVLYGRNLSAMAFVFHELSEKGWDRMKAILVHD